MTLLSTRQDAERAILVGIECRRRSGRRPPDPTADPDYTAEESLEELSVLASSVGAEVLDSVLQSRFAPDAATLIGRGKVEELHHQIKAAGANLALFDHELTPTQLRNLERALHVRVVDRTQLILDIFARRARTREGQLQVELAQLNYLLPRLTGRGVEMSRLGGGIGTRGPGETQLETDRRRIHRRIRKIELDLETVRGSRSTQRKQRQAIPLATVALVGYTNAGKSTLFNRLTGAGVAADARMFATLDPTVRAVTLPSRRRVLLSDTVGFIRNLPTTLVRAFRATLEEVTQAALLLHIVDASSEHSGPQTSQVRKVLDEIGAEKTPQILIWNKLDLLPSPPPATAEGIAVSARTGEGMEALLAAIDRALELDPVSAVRLRIPLSDGAAIHLVHEAARIVTKRYEDDYCDIDAEVPESIRQRLATYIQPAETPAGRHRR